MSSPRVDVVGLGPGDQRYVTEHTRALLDASRHCFLRTQRHPAADVAPGAAISLDDEYERAETFESVYAAIADRLVETARGAGPVVYAVPGSPLVLERSVELLRHDDRCQVVLHPAMSFLDLVWARLGVDPVDSGVRLVDGHCFATSAAGAQGPLLVAHCHSQRVLSDLKLAVDDPGDEPVVVLQRLGTAEETIVEVDWWDLDRAIEADHLTSLFIPSLAAPVGQAFVALAELVSTLRAECPWDRAQTHQSLRRHLLEESYEAIEAIDAVDVDRGSGYDHLEEELGDLLFQVFFHSELAREEGHFDVSDVARGIHEKLRRRHPHVFGDGSVDADEVVATWEQSKMAEKGRSSVMDGIPTTLPALLLALKVQKKAAALGFGVADLPAAFDDVDAELDEARADPSAHEVGDLLFAAVQVARQADVDPESALTSAARRFRNRFEAMETQATRDGCELPALDPTELAQRWAAAKAAEATRQ